MVENLQKDITYIRIKEMIVKGEFAMGEKLSERTLELNLNAHKAPIRDALKRLQAEGLVVRKAKSGTYVFSLNKKELLNLLNFRYVMESEALRLSFVHNQKKLITKTESIIIKMKSALAQNLAEEYLKQDSIFHESLVSLCDNQYFITAFLRLAAIMDTTRNFLGNNLEHMQRSMQEHQHIAAAICEKNIDKAVNLLKEHILPEFGAYWKNFNKIEKHHACYYSQPQNPQ